MSSPNPCNATLRQGVLQWLQKSKAQSLGKYIVYAAAFSVLEALREHGWPLERSDYISEKNQIRMSGAKFRRVLGKALGAERVERLNLPKEGGRTTRSGPTIADDFIGLLIELLPSSLTTRTTAKAFADCLEAVIAEDFERYILSLSGIRVSKPPAQYPLSEFVRDVLEAADKRRGAVAHHLVGAKLTLRLGMSKGLVPRSYTAADQQAEVPGDYWCESTAFHVTVAPTEALVRKCRNNIAKGWRVWIITTRERVEMTRGMVEVAGLSKQVQVSAISDFLGQNLEEIGSFSSQQIPHQAEDLVREYNHRIDQAENGDPTLKIEFGS